MASINDLSSYFGKNYQSNPTVSSLTPAQQNAITVIVKKAKDLGITSNVAIAALLAIVSKESAFQLHTEIGYGGTPSDRIRQVFGSKRLSKYTNQELDAIKKSDKDFFDVVYGPPAKATGYAVYGNDNKYDGFKFRGRGFNGITFRDIYKKRGAGIGLDLLSSPELLEQIDPAAAALVDYFISGFNTYKEYRKMASALGYEIKNSALNTINGIQNIDSAVRAFYTMNQGPGGYEHYLKYDVGAYKDSSGYTIFPNDTLGGWTRARNRAPYFYQILTGNKLTDTSPVSNPSSPTQSTPGDVQPPNTIEQNKTDDEYNGSSQNKNTDFNPVQLTQLFKPTIKPLQISLDANNSSKKQKKEFLTGMGTAPVIWYNGIHIEYADISHFELYHEDVLPAIKITFRDRNGIFKDTGFPTDDATISVFIYSRSKRLRSINMDFKVTKFKEIESNLFMISGISNISEIFLRKFKSYSKKTSFEALQDIAKECELGFCTNISNTSDKMTWINTGFPNYQFIGNIVKNSYLSDEAFLNCYVDFYYNLCYVEIEKELDRENSNDLMIVSNGKNEFTEDPEQDEDIGPLMLSTDKSVKDTNSYISKYEVINRSTQVSLDRAYITKTKFYDTKNKNLLIFDLDSITSEGDKTIIMKGKPGDERFFTDNVNNIWMGKLDKFEDDGSGNAHTNFNYSFVQNEINIDELNKIEIEITLPSPNFNLYILQKVYLALLKDKPGLNHTSLRYKRLIGNWLTTNISYIFDGKKHYQKINLIKRELELDDNEKESSKDNSSLKKSNADDNQDHDNPLSPTDNLPPNPQVPQLPGATSSIIKPSGATSSLD